MRLLDLLPEDDLSAAVSAGYVRVQRHPNLPLTILNYTEKAQYENAWTPVTRTCRGLIVHADTGQVVARPFGKFFNHGQPGAPVLDLGASVVATDKMDGSLGVIYPTGDGQYAVATRGSFTSDQALHATAVWRDRYALRAHIVPGYTYLVEIIYPGNRIVVDYRGVDDLVLIGIVDNPTGWAIPQPAAWSGWPGPAAAVLPHYTFAEALAAPPRPGFEGMVVMDVRTNTLVKIKQDDYVALHRIVTGLNARTVWEAVRTGGLDDLVAGLPDEFHPWVQAVEQGLRAQVDQAYDDINFAYGDVLTVLPDGYTRKDFAMQVKNHPLAWALFMLADGRDPGERLWDRARPEGNITPAGAPTEDTA